MNPVDDLTKSSGTEAGSCPSAASVDEFEAFVVTSPRSWERPIVALIVTVLAYVALIALLGGRAHLGGDTGGRAAVLRSVDTGEHAHFDVGYFALDADPDLSLHPLYYTQLLDGRAQQVSTVPMVWLARPLYRLGGESLTLALPMLGAIAAAFAASALARRLGAPRPMLAYWIVALASPVTIYALDLWEHTLGLAAGLWAIVALERPVTERLSVARAIGVGALFGVGATLRTELLVIGAVFGGAAVLRRVVDQRHGDAVRCAVGGALGAVAVWVANDGFERIVLGASLRTARAGDAASSAGSSLVDRVDDAWVTFAGLNYADVGFDRALAGSFVLGLVVATVAASRHQRFVVGAGVVVASGAIAWRLAGGLSFLPGLVVVLPLVVVGLVAGLGERRTRALTLTSAVAFVAIWLTAYSGMPGAQWGGRYLFVPGVVLVVVATVTAVGRGFVGKVAMVLGAVVTLCGLLYLRVRIDEVSRAHDAVSDYEALEVDLMVSRLPFLWRDLGSQYSPDRAWLTAVDDEGVAEAARLANDRSDDVVVVIREAEEPEDVLPGFEAIVEDPFPWIGRNLVAVLYLADKAGAEPGV